MLTRRERLLATLQGQPVDRPAVSFYEIGGWKTAADNDEVTVHNGSRFVAVAPDDNS